MTHEQLDEIEKRWAGYLEKNEVERRFLFDQWWDKRDFWDMTKALREAWKALDQVSSDDRMSEAQITATILHAQEQKDEAIRQRDEARSALEWQAAMTKALSESQERLVQEVKEARAEVKRLREVVRQVHTLASQGDDLVHGWIDPTLREIHKITKEQP